MSSSTTPETNYDAYLGFWTNWSKGPINGATLTTSRESGGLLVAFLAIYVAAAGKSFWRLACLALHRYFCSNKPQDGLHHQRQAIIRNTETPESAIWTVILIFKAWRKRTKGPCRRLGLMFMLSMAISIGFAVAGVFSSRVTTGTVSEILLTGKNCRRLGNSRGMDDTDYRALYDPWKSKEHTTFLSYAQKCYINAQTDQDCQRFAKSRIPLQVKRNVGCPFDQLCKTGSIVVDTGLMDSNMDLGINLPRKFQIKIRMVNECVPIKTDGYTSIHNQKSFPDIPLHRLHFGKYIFPDGNGTDFIYQVPANLSTHLYEDFNFILASRAKYEIGTARVSDVPKNYSRPQDSKLIPSLQNSTGDVGLVFLSSPGIIYSKEIDDPWYSAHTKGPMAMFESGKKKIQFWYQDEPVSVLGCIEQYQICVPNTTKGWSCQPLRGKLETLTRFADEHPEYNDDQEHPVSWLAALISQAVSPTEIIGWNGESALSSKYSHGKSISGLLPNTQWEQEVIWWASTQVTSLQSAFVEYANGPPGLDPQIAILPKTNGSKLLCESQRMISSLYFSFNVLGTSLILILGGIIILTNLFFEWILDILKGRQGKNDYWWQEWKSNNVLQLQRLAYENAGSGTWEKVEDEIPVTLVGECLLPLDVTDRKHPRLIPHSVNIN